MLKGITARIRAVNSGVIQNEFKYETYHQIVDALISLVDVFSEVICLAISSSLL
jgi:hypothetical protein